MKKLLVVLVLLVAFAAIAYASLNNRKSDRKEVKKELNKAEKKKECRKSCLFS